MTLFFWLTLAMLIYVGNNTFNKDAVSLRIFNILVFAGLVVILVLAIRSNI